MKPLACLTYPFPFQCTFVMDSENNGLTKEGGRCCCFLFSHYIRCINFAKVAIKMTFIRKTEETLMNFYKVVSHG